MGAPLPGGAVERLIEEDIEAIAQSFQLCFNHLSIVLRNQMF